MWLTREGSKTPIQLLGVSEQDIKAAGLRVIDWDVPTPLPTLPGPRRRGVADDRHSREPRTPRRDQEANSFGVTWSAPP
jgi:hypothetical protein